MSDIQSISNATTAMPYQIVNSGLNGLLGTNQGSSSATGGNSLAAPRGLPNWNIDLGSIFGTSNASANSSFDFQLKLTEMHSKMMSQMMNAMTKMVSTLTTAFSGIIDKLMLGGRPEIANLGSIVPTPASSVEDLTQNSELGTASNAEMSSEALPEDSGFLGGMYNTTQKIEKIVSSVGNIISTGSNIFFDLLGGGAKKVSGLIGKGIKLIKGLF